MPFAAGREIGVSSVLPMATIKSVILRLCHSKVFPNQETNGLSLPILSAVFEIKRDRITELNLNPSTVLHRLMESEREGECHLFL